MLLGGVLTDVLDWHWIFLVNIPVGVVVFALSLRSCPPAPVSRTDTSTSPARSP